MCNEEDVAGATSQVCEGAQADVRRDRQYHVVPALPGGGTWTLCVCGSIDAVLSVLGALLRADTRVPGDITIRTYDVPAGPV